MTSGGGDFNLNWDAVLGSRGGDLGDRLERRDRHPLPHPAFRQGRRPDLGRQLPAQPAGAATRAPTGRRCRASTASSACRWPAPCRGSRSRISATSSSSPTCSTRAGTRFGAGSDGRRGLGRTRGRLRPQVLDHPGAHPRRHLQHRLRPGRGRRVPDQPRPLQPLLPREAALLPRERRPVLGRGRRGDRALLQPPDRHRCLAARRSRSTAACACRAR